MSDDDKRAKAMQRLKQYHRTVELYVQHGHRASAAERIGMQARMVMAWAVVEPLVPLILGGGCEQADKRKNDGRNYGVRRAGGSTSRARNDSVDAGHKRVGRGGRRVEGHNRSGHNA